MLDAGGGGGGTPWESMTLDQMHALIQNPDTDKQWDLVSGWQKSAELLSEHRWQVQDYRDNLASAWPPEKSTASAAYLARLDGLIKNLDETYEASLANHDAFSSATGSIYQAQFQMKKIYEEYKSNESLLTTYNQQQQAKQNSSEPTPSPSPSGDEPPVAPGRQEALRQQAITLLSGVSTDLAQAQVKIQKPPVYKVDFVEDSKTANDGGGYTAPPIPPITPAPVTGGGSTSSSSTRPSTTFPTSPSGGVVSPSPATPSTPPGLVLGGTGTPLPPTSTLPTTGLTPTLPSTGPVTGPGLLPTSPFVPGGGSPSLKPPTTGLGGRVGGLPNEAALRAGGGRLPQGMKAMPAGGVIGQMPGGAGSGRVGGGALGQPGAGRAGAGVRRVNPVGGVIGEGEHATGGARGTSAGANGMYGRGGARGTERRDEADGMQWDPDNPWETAEGVEPVVNPAPERRIDPGPAIGLG